MNIVIYDTLKYNQSAHCRKTDRTSTVKLYGVNKLEIIAKYDNKKVTFWINYDEES